MGLPLMGVGSVLRIDFMVSVMTSSTGVKWDKLSFASTLYLYPIIDTLLERAPTQMRDELRLGLQEALVNAAKHGNSLDPSKHVSVQYARVDGSYRSEEHTSELQSPVPISYAVFCLKKKKKQKNKKKNKKKSLF